MAERVAQEEDPAGEPADGGELSLTLEELAEVTGVPPRTIRFYQAEKLLQKPERDRKDARVARYGTHHVERLRLVGELRDRGLKLPAIRTLLQEGDASTRVADWLGLDATLRGSFGPDEPRLMSRRELAPLLEGTPPGTQGHFEEAGLLVRQGDSWLVPAPALLDIAVRLVADGVDIDLVLQAGVGGGRLHGAALAAAQAQGVHVTLASGRSYPSMRRWATELGITAPLVTYQGAEVVDPQTHRTLLQRSFSRVLVPELRDFARHHDLSLTLYADGRIYVENKRESDAFYDQWFGLPFRIVPDLAEAAQAEPIKFLIIGQGPDLDALRPLVERRFGERMQIVRSHAYFLEGLALGADKGAALAWVADQLGVHREETMAVGDSGNDIAMVAWAGVGTDRYAYDMVTSYETMRACKPHPAFFSRVLAELGREPHECLMVGDSISSDMPAAKLGIKTFWIDRARGGSYDGADGRGSLSDLYHLLKSGAIHEL